MELNSLSDAFISFWLKIPSEFTQILVMLKSQPNRSGRASADLGLAGRAWQRPGLGPTRPGRAWKFFFIF